MGSRSITQENKDIPPFLKIEMINMHFDRGMSVAQIRNEYRYPFDQIVRLLIMANLEMERFIIIESKMNYV